MADEKLSARSETFTTEDNDYIHIIRGGVSWKIKKSTFVSDVGTDIGGESFLRSDIAATKTAGDLILPVAVNLDLGTGRSFLSSDGVSTVINLISDNFIIKNNSVDRLTLDRITGAVNVSGDFSCSGIDATDTFIDGILDVTGNVTANNMTAVSFFESSDKRLKSNIEPISETFSSFNFIDDKNKRYGVIAQEIEKSNPELVKNDKNGLKSVNYIDLLCKTVAEQENKIERLEKLVEKLISNG